MDRRKYLGIIGTGISAAFAGCGGNGGGGGGGGGGTEAGGGGGGTEAGGGGGGTEAGGGGGGTEAGGGGTEAQATEAEATPDEETGTAGGETTAESSPTESGGVNASVDADNTPSGGGSGEVTDSGTTDVSLNEVTVADSLNLDTVGFYNEGDGFTAGVRGEVTNISDSSIDFVDIQTLFYNSEDTRIGEGLDNASSLPPGETYAFDALYFDTADPGEIASYSITISDSII